MATPAPQPFAFVDEALAPFGPALGEDRQSYRNHVQRVLHHFVALSGGDAAVSLSVQVAAPFHDLGIWTAGNFDYIEPSVALALQQLQRLGRDDLRGEVELLICEHHRIGRYRGPHAAAVEAYRRADWIDVSLGLLRFGLPLAHVRSVHRAFPDAGFHARLARLTLRQCLQTPWRPLPMMRW